MRDELEDLMRLGFTLVGIGCLVGLAVSIYDLVGSSAFDVITFLKAAVLAMVGSLPVSIKVIKLVFKTLDYLELPLKIVSIVSRVTSKLLHKEEKALLEWDNSKNRFS